MARLSVRSQVWFKRSDGQEARCSFSVYRYSLDTVQFRPLGLPVSDGLLG